MKKSIIVIILDIIVLIATLGLYFFDYLPVKYHKTAKEVIDMAHVATKDHPEVALFLYKESLRLKPFNPQGVYHDMGSLYIRLEKYEKALEALNKADEIYQGSNMCVTYMKGISYRELERAEEAKENFMKAINNFKPGGECHMKALYWLSYTLGMEKNYKEALKYANMFEKMYPQDIVIIVGLKGYVLAGINGEQAYKYYKDHEKYVKNMSNKAAASFYYDWGIVADKEEAIEKYKKALEYNPKHEYANSEICDEYAKLGNGKEAVKYCEIGNFVYPHPLGYEHTCYAYYVDKQYDRAKSMCSWLIENNYITPAVYYDSALIEQALGNKEKALEYIDKAIDSLMNWEEETSQTKVNLSLRKGDKGILAKYEKLKKELEKMK